MLDKPQESMFEILIFSNDLYGQWQLSNILALWRKRN